jgi:hypothetical protein
VTVAPNTRKHMLAHMGKTCEGFYRELAKGFHEHPQSSEAQQLVIEAAALGLCAFADKTPNGLAQVQCYLHELQDYINKAMKEIKK